MRKLFRHLLLFSDPTGNEPSPEKFCKELLAPYGCTGLPYLMHARIFPDDDQAGNGPINEKKFKYHLTHGKWIPQDSWCFLNVEPANPAHKPWEPLEEFPWARPQQEGIDFFSHILDVAQEERPDVVFGFYGRFPHAPYQWSLIPECQQAREELMVACGPLVRRLGFLTPSFEDRFVRPEPNGFDDRLQWIGTILEEARRFYPDIPIIGVTRMEYLDLWYKRPDPDTPEHQKLRRLSGYTWLRQNQTILDHADGVLWVGGGNTGNSGKTKWDKDAEWWKASMQLMIDD